MASQPPTYEDATDFPVEASDSNSERPNSQEKIDHEFPNEKKESAAVIQEEPPIYNAEADDHFGETAVLSTAKDLVTHIVHVQDDPSLSPWTFRMFFIGRCFDNSLDQYTEASILRYRLSDFCFRLTRNLLLQTASNLRLSCLSRGAQLHPWGGNGFLHSQTWRHRPLPEPLPFQFKRARRDGHNGFGRRCERCSHRNSSSAKALLQHGP